MTAQINRKRWLWNHIYAWVGRLAVAPGIANVYIGLHLSNVRGSPKGWMISSMLERNHAMLWCVECVS